MLFDYTGRPYYVCAATEENTWTRPVTPGAALDTDTAARAAPEPEQQVQLSRSPDIRNVTQKSHPQYWFLG